MEYMHLAEEGNLEILKEIYDIIVTTLPYRIVSHPAAGKMVISHTDTLFKTKIHVSEAMATCCEVEVDGNPGYGCVPGNDPQRAEYAAMIDSLIWHDHPAIEKISPLIKKIKDELYCKWKTRRLELCV